MPIRKRKDNHQKFMKKLKRATQETLTEAAQKLQLISKQLVSRPYTGGKRRQNKRARSNGQTETKPDGQN